MIREARINDLDIINNYLSKMNNHFINANELTSHPFFRYVVLMEDSKIVGFLSYSLIYDKMELNYIYVDEQFRGKGYASKLMDYLINEAEINKCINITLEVEINNKSAINLYHKYKFIDTAIRKNYYGNNDGILMMKKLGD